jgi:carboxyl-terminal processing protease
MIKKIRNRFVRLILMPTLAIGLLVFSAFQLNFFEVSKNLDIFTNAYKEVNLYYVDDVPPAALMEAAIEGMLESLDPYTNFIPENKIEDFRIQTTGQYGGIGASIRKIGDYVVVVLPYKDFPADKAGLKAGDLLLEVDGKSLKGLDTEEVSDLLKGSPGTQLDIKVKRGALEFKKQLTREEVQLKSVPYYGVLENNIGYITLTSFTDKASKEVREALTALKDSHNISGLVFDLRGNPGGLLPEAVNVTNIFIPKGVEVVRTRGKVKEMDRTYHTLNEPLDTDIPLVVLINGSSASASEIVSGTLQDLDRAVIIGQRSFGKGLVQQPRKLSYGAQMKITIAKYYTAAGRCIQAINYAERDEEGNLTRVPDSLRNPFKTKAGRIVYDGAGIDPDLPIEPQAYSNILISLIGKSHVFEFANQFASKNKTIAPAGTFALTDADYDQFVAFLNGKDYSYETRTERAIAQLMATAEAEQYSDLETDISHMKSLMKESKAADLNRHKPEIKKFLEEEIAARYYYQEGRIAQSIQKDPEVLEALKVLQNKSQYQEILRLAN